MIPFNTTVRPSEWKRLVPPRLRREETSKLRELHARLFVPSMQNRIETMNAFWDYTESADAMVRLGSKEPLHARLVVEAVPLVDRCIRANTYAVGCGSEQLAFDHRFQMRCSEVEFTRIASQMLRQAIAISRAVSQRLVHVL